MTSTLGFGRYRDRDIQSVPRGYLRWVRDNVKLGPLLAYAVDCVINKQPVDPESVDLRTDEEKAEAIIRPWAG